MYVTSRSRFVAALTVAAALVLLIGASAKAGTVYFTVAEISGREAHHDSYVLPLTDPADIAHARDLIARGPDTVGRSIAFAHIAPGSGGGVNRDLLAPGQHEWSWHVDGFNGFNDLGIELIDGNPSYVETHLTDWLRETNGQVGFWNYTVVRELPASYPANRPGAAVPVGDAVVVAGVMLVGMVMFQARGGIRRALR